MFRLITLGAFIGLLLMPESLAEAQAMTREQFFSRYGAHLEQAAPPPSQATDDTATDVEHETASEEESEETEEAVVSETESDEDVEVQEPSRPLTPEERREERLARGRPELGSLPPSADTALHRSGDLAGTGPPLAAVGIASLLSALGFRRWRSWNRIEVNPDLL